MNNDDIYASYFYDLSKIDGFKSVVENQKIPENYEKHMSIVHSTNNKCIVHYNKTFLRPDLISSIGLLRSVIVNQNKVVCFSPPKSLSAEDFMSKYAYPEKNTSIYAEEFVEGIMVNLFYTDEWNIATRNNIGGNIKIYNLPLSKTVSQMFYECLSPNEIDNLDKKYCYSFVLQHPENRIVIPIKKPQLYLIEIYEIINADDKILILNHNVSKQLIPNVMRPKQYVFETYTELITKYASRNTSYNVMGVIIKHCKTGERTKIRNPVYEEVCHLKGSKPKLQYQYLCLRHSGMLPEYLKHYPEFKTEMSQFRDQVHYFTDNLHQNYISCYVKKVKPLEEYSTQYRGHMHHLHSVFLNELRPQKLYVSNTVVKNYVNSLAPSLLMYCLNHHLRQRHIHSIKK